jgi:hypothetical protein
MRMVAVAAAAKRASKNNFQIPAQRPPGTLWVPLPQGERGVIIGRALRETL